jgi:SAM-dependent methyltransferase
MTGSVARNLAKTVVRHLEPVVWGGRVRERVLVALLREHYASLLRRHWSDADRVPHFFDHRIGAFGFATGSSSPFSYYRGYFAAELIRPADRVLDIGCGDGFFARRFFSPKCNAVDAIDIEPSAIAHASRYNRAPNITYTLLDAVHEPFPSGCYDVVVWDGGLGHVATSDTDEVLAKIRDVLSPDGAFVGSESLGREGEDHLQFFASRQDLSRLLERHFPHVQVRSLEYALPDFTRHEGFWRCAASPGRLEEAAWSSCSPS